MDVYNAGAFTGVQYFNPYWQDQPTPGASDHLHAEFSFQAGPRGRFLSHFIEALTDALAVVEPEFAIEDVELGEGGSTESWKQDILPKDQAANSYDEVIAASSERSLRTLMVSNGMDTLVLSLYNGAPPSLKVAAGAPVGVFKLDAGTSGVYTTIECYGCTAVALSSSKPVLIQHLIGTQFQSSTSDTIWVDAVISTLESTLIANKDD